MKRLSTGAASLALSLVFLSATEARGSSVTLFETVFNTDYVSSAIGVRGLSGGPITVTGVSGPVTQAVLFWRGPKSSGDPNVSSAITFDGASVTGTNTESADGSGGGTYRADVTPFVGGNGSYSVGGMPNGIPDGARLFVFFDDGNDANNHDVALFNGGDSNAVDTSVGVGGGIAPVLAGGPDLGELPDLRNFANTSLAPPAVDTLTTDPALDDLETIGPTADVPPIANPEPTTLLLVGAGLALAARRARRSV